MGEIIKMDSEALRPPSEPLVTFSSEVMDAIEPLDLSTQGSFLEDEVRAASAASAVSVTSDVSIAPADTEAEAEVTVEQGKKILKASKKTQKLQKKLDKTKIRLSNVANRIEELKSQDYGSCTDDDYDDYEPPGYNYRYNIPRYGSMDYRDRFSTRDGYHLGRFFENNSRICPDDNLELYLKRVDEMLELDKKLDSISKKTQDLYTSVLGEFRKSSPEKVSTFIDKGRCFNSVTDAYNVIKSNFARGDGCTKQEYDRLVAALEVVGQIIFTPFVLNRARNDVKGKSSLEVGSFTSKSTRNRIEKISWSTERRGVQFHFVQRSILRMG